MVRTGKVRMGGGGRRWAGGCRGAVKGAAEAEAEEEEEGRRDGWVGGRVKGGGGDGGLGLGAPLLDGARERSSIEQQQRGGTHTAHHGARHAAPRHSEAAQSVCRRQQGAVELRAILLVHGVELEEARCRRAKEPPKLRLSTVIT